MDNNLNNAAAELNGALDAAETVFRNAGMCRNVRLTLQLEDPTEYYALVFGQLDERWSLYVVKADGGQMVKLTSAPLRVRVAAAKRLGDLFAMLRAAQGVAVSEVQKATKDVYVFIDGISE